MSLRITVLGCGSSGGVPRIGGDWGRATHIIQKTVGGGAPFLSNASTGWAVGAPMFLWIPHRISAISFWVRERGRLMACSLPMIMPIMCMALMTSAWLREMAAGGSMSIMTRVRGER